MLEAFLKRFIKVIEYDNHTSIFLNWGFGHRFHVERVCNVVLTPEAAVDRATSTTVVTLQDWSLLSIRFDQYLHQVIEEHLEGFGCVAFQPNELNSDVYWAILASFSPFKEVSVHDIQKNSY